MPYSASLRTAIGAVRAALESNGLRRQSARFAEHGIHEPAPDAPLVLVACSGGRDSMALAAVAHTVCGMLGLRCGAAIVDHGLQDGSADVARAAAERCRALGLDPVTVRRVNVDGTCREGLEAAARDARYDALVGIAADCGACAVLLAHTLDDQAETVLIGLARSGGLDAITGMPAVTVRHAAGSQTTGLRFVRPWLNVTRAQTTAVCRELNLRWWDDPTNGDGADADVELDGSYPLRSRIRHDLLPAMARCYGRNPAASLAAGAASARIDADYLDRAAECLAARAVTADDGRDPTSVRLDADLLAGEHPALRRRVIVRALRMAGVPVAAVHVEAIDRLIVDWHGQRPLALPSQCTAIRKGHVIEVCKDRRHANR